MQSDLHIQAFLQFCNSMSALGDLGLKSIQAMPDLLLVNMDNNHDVGRSIVLDQLWIVPVVITTESSSSSMASKSWCL